MPPHPSLQGKIAQGRVQVPTFFTDPVRRAERKAAKKAVRQAAVAAKGLGAAALAPAPMTGTLKALAVVVDFSDNVHTVTPTFFDSLIFGAPIASGLGSVRDFYAKVSYGQVDIVTVNLPSSLGWQRAPQTYAYYTNFYYGVGSYPNNCQKLAEDIVDALHAAGVDFSQYDNTQTGLMAPIMLIHAGPGAEFTGNINNIWSHSWSLANPRTYNGVVISDYIIMPEYWSSATATTSDMTIGVFAHEIGHGFWDLPDLYDTTYSSEGLSYWSLMASGSWNGPNGMGAGPAWPDAWCRVQMGFVNPTAVTGSAPSKAIPQAYNNPAPAQTVLKLRTPVMGPQEYFLIENRQKTPNTYDYYLPGSGLLVYHVDEAVSSNDHPCSVFPPCSCSVGNHYLVSLQQANGELELEKGLSHANAGHPFPGTSDNRHWSNSTNPNSGSWYTCNNTGISVTNISNSGPTMTADIQVGTTGGEIPAINLLLGD